MKYLGCAFLLIALVSCGSVPVKSTFVEKPDPSGDTCSYWPEEMSGMHAAILGTDKAFRMSVCPDVEEISVHEVSAWKGETVSAMVLIWSASDLENVRVDVSKLRGRGGVIPSSAVETFFVRYTLADEFGNACGPHDPAVYPPHLCPDMLEPAEAIDIPGRTVRPVWIRINVPAEAAEGCYTASVKVVSSNAGSRVMTLKLNVTGRTMPELAARRFYIDFWQHPAAVARVEGCRLWSDEHFALLEKYMRPLADLGQRTVTATLNKDPWNHQCYDLYEDMILWTRDIDGTWSYDYTVFDRWVELMDRLGVNREVNCYSMLPWNNELHYFDMAADSLVNVKADPGTAVFEELWRPFLHDFSAHLTEKGWVERVNIAMDERSREQMGFALELLRDAAPALGVAMADNHNSYRNYPDVDNISCSIWHTADPSVLASRRADGRITTFYICRSAPFPNQFTFSSPMEAVYVTWYSIANGYDGFLRWAWNSWPEDPAHDSRFRTFPSGDCFLAYPGPMSSVRIEKLREGIQDMEKIFVLRDEYSAAGDTAALAALDSTLAMFAGLTPDEGWEDRLLAARESLNR